MSKHTPGPWVFEEQTYSSSSYYIRGHDLKTGRTMTWGKGAVAHIPRSTVMPMEANARLIAAAPELLEALRDTLDFVERHSNRWDGSNGNHPFAIVAAARAAIAKATGEKA